MPVREANSRRSKDIQISVKPFFDSHEEYSGLAKAHFAGFIKKNPRAAEVLLPPTYEDDITTMPLQVADTLAYETRKVLARQIKNPVDDYMRVPMQRLLPAIYRVYRLDYEALKTIVRMQVADSVAIPHKKIDELC